MKTNKHFLRISLACCAISAALVSCGDDEPDIITPPPTPVTPVTPETPDTPEVDVSNTAANLPSAVRRVLAQYGGLKTYAPAGFTLGLGVGKDVYTNDAARRQLVNDNFQMVTWGNAMKHDAVVQDNGTLRFTSLDAGLDAIKAAGLGLYGHNFIWHTQQNQTYLKSLISPTVEGGAKSAEQKREALLAAMESWIKGMAEHLSEKGIVPQGYDVINEAIADGTNKLRGIDGVFGGSDKAPTETATALNLNWESGHFYWGYYVKDYGVQAFQMARKYLPAETKLFINDYNLETSPGKLQALINWVNAIDQANGTPIVDGLGTQMHVGIAPTNDAVANATLVADLKKKVDAQFQTMAKTGKLVRVTELDIDMCNYVNGQRQPITSPSAAQFKCQADAFQMIVESYLANVPKAQQSGISIWSLTDQDDEHRYWLTNGLPNLFNKQNLRKWAYKGVADGLAGQDIGLTFNDADYKAYSEQ